jgi:hypothetical protein
MADLDARAELAEYLTNVCAFAKRQQHITANPVGQGASADGWCAR